MEKSWLRLVLWMVPLLPTMGCAGTPDERLAEVAMQSTARQAEQNQQMAELQQQVAEGARKLVEADAQARRDWSELQREFRSDQAEISRQRDALESERREIAGDRYWDSILGPSIYAGAGILACLLPLLLCGWLLHATRDKQGTDEALAELLAEELTTDRPLLLPRRQSMPVLEHQPPTRFGAVPSDGPTDAPGG